jgi:hypothetical protein
MRLKVVLAAGILSSTLGFLPYCPALATGAQTPPPSNEGSYYNIIDAPEIAVDWSKGNLQLVTLGGDRAFTFAGGNPGGRYVLAITQDQAGSRRVTWPASVRWPGRGNAPSLTATAGRTDYIGFIYNPKSRTYDGVSFSQDFCRRAARRLRRASGSRRFPLGPRCVRAVGLRQAFRRVCRPPANHH